MAITFDTPTTSTSPIFSTTRVFSHTVGGGDDRYIWVCISTEDFGGVVQTPTSVTYGGNALVLDGIVKSGVQTCSIYSGQDSVCGTAGPHNVAISFADTVDALVAIALSANEMAQAVAEATGSTVALDGFPQTGGTSNITTVTNGAVIIACAGNDNANSPITTSWNVGIEDGDTVPSSHQVAGASIHYEKVTAGAQAITTT